MNTKFLIVGSYRSGTTLLNEALFNHPDLKVTFEAFHEDAKSGNVLWRDELGIELSKTQDFTKIVFDNFDGCKILYHQLPSSDPLWRFFLKSGVKVIHVVRDNIAEIVVSFLACHQNGIWQNRSGLDIQEKVKIAPEDLHNRIKSVESKMNDFTAILDGSLVIKYNTMVNHWQATVNKVCDYLNVSRLVLPQTTQKRTRPLDSVLSDIESHRVYFRGTPYYKFFSKPIPLM